MEKVTKWIIVNWNADKLTYDLLTWSHLEDDIIERLPKIREKYPNCRVFIEWSEFVNEQAEKQLYSTFLDIFERM